MTTPKTVILDTHERAFLKILAGLKRPATRDDVGVTTSLGEYRARQRCRRLLLATFHKKTATHPAGWVLTERGKRVYKDPNTEISISQPK